MTARRGGIAVPRSQPPDRDPDDWMRSARFVLFWLIGFIIFLILLYVVVQYLGL